MRFKITDPIDLEPIIPLVVKRSLDVLGWQYEFLGQKITFNRSYPVRATIIQSYKIINPHKGNQSSVFNISFHDIKSLNFTPQIQVLDLPVIIRDDKIRLNCIRPIVFNFKSTGWKYRKTIPIYVVLMALTNVLLIRDNDLSVHERICLTPDLPTSASVDSNRVVLARDVTNDLLPQFLSYIEPLYDQYKGLDEIIKQQVIDPLTNHIERGESVIKYIENAETDIEITNAMRREVYDRDIFKWLGKYITRRNEAKVGRRHIVEMLYGYLLDIFNHPYYDYPDDLIKQIVVALWKYHNNRFVDENDWNNKRFRLREYLLHPILEELVRIASGHMRKTVNLKLTKYWYESRLFVYNSIVNPLALLSLQTRCTIKGPGALVYPTKVHRSVHDSMKDKVDSISTGEREQAGVVHMVLFTELDELTGIEGE